MKEPRKKWQRVRLATLERADRRVMKLFRPVSTLTFAVCMVYLIGFLRLQLFEVDFTQLAWVDSVQIILFGVAAFLVPISVGATLMAFAIKRRFSQLLGDYAVSLDGSPRSRVKSVP